MRVYGILEMDGKILVADELIRGRKITKFPGGGLELGEGTEECLKREFKEELNWDIRILSHFYTTDFFVLSAFDDSQVLSIYYKVEVTTSSSLELINTEQLSFRWLEKQSISENDFDLVIDKKVGQLLNQLNRNT